MRRIDRGANLAQITLRHPAVSRYFARTLLRRAMAATRIRNRCAVAGDASDCVIGYLRDLF